MAEEAKKKVKLPTAEKRVIQDAKKALINKQFKSKARTTIRSFEEAVANKDTTAIPAKLKEVFSVLDKGVKRNIFKLNKASRLKAKCSTKAAAK